MRVPLAVALYASFLAPAMLAPSPPAPPLKKKRRLNLESWQRRRLVGAKGLRP